MYDSNAKQTFGRGWAINRIIERLPVHPSSARVVCLAGEDHDRQCLIRKGFANHNIISIDRDAEPVERVRGEGGIAIRGPVQEVLRCWPDDWKVNALLLDFNCGLDPAVFTALGALLDKPFRSAIVYLNLQRGRDWCGRLLSDGRPALPTKNRAEIALFTWAQVHVVGAPDAHKFSHAEQWECLKILQSDLRSVLAQPYRQKQGGVLMDGCIFRVPDERWGRIVKSTDVSLTRKVIAARAVSTRLRNAAA